MKSTLLLIIVFLLLFSPSKAQDGEMVSIASSEVFGQDSTIQALYITGGGWHDYESQKELLTEGISKYIGEEIKWTIIHEGDGEPDHQVSILKKEDWAKNYDVVVHNTGFGRVKDAEFVSKLVDNHKGTPAVLIHASIHSYRYAKPADDWFKFMGIQSMWHEDQRPLKVETLASNHLIMNGVPKNWTTPPDELYVIKDTLSKITPLTQTFGRETKKYHPVAWTHEAEGIRVFATTLGHNNEIFKREEFITMIAQGLLWAVK